MTALNKQALLIENGQLVADTLRHLADNEIDSDYFAITSTNENGTEIDHELVITDYALQAAGTVDELVRALEAAEKRIAELNRRLIEYAGIATREARRVAELEARAVSIPEVRITVAESKRKNLTWRELGAYNEGADVAKERISKVLAAAGIKVKGE